MKPGIEFKIIWADFDVTELRVCASNGRFGGTVDAYVQHTALGEFAAVLSGFPSSALDHRARRFGSFEPTRAGGGATLDFRCNDAAGHAIVEVRLRSDPQNLYGHEETATLVINVEASAIDAFVVEVSNMGAQVGAKAFLPATEGI